MSEADYVVKISVIGAGYVGLVTCVGLALKGHDVICVEKIQEKVDAIQKGNSTIYENNLDKFLSKVLDKNFRVTTDIRSAVENSDVTIVCVGTYPKEDGSIDLSQVEGATKSIGGILKTKNSYHVVVIKSTVIPTTTRKFVMPILEKESGKKCGTDFGLCVNPEFLREGNAIEDFIKPDRIIIGGDEKSTSILDVVYEPFNTKIIKTSLEAAELIKYANNAFLGLLVSYSNELENISESIGVDFNSVLEGLYHDNRLSPKVNNEKIFPEILSYLSAGPGFGGSCLPKDISALIKFSEESGYEPKMIKSILEINQNRPEKMVGIMEKQLQNLNGKTITVLGVAFKPNTDDVRFSPSIEIIILLLKRGARVKIYDPAALNNAKMLLEDKIIYSNSIEDSLKDSDGCFLVTKWKEFEIITPDMLKNNMKNPLIVDCRRMLDATKFLGKVNYVGIGLGKIN